MYNNSNFFAILPSAVRYNSKLTPRAILLYALLTSLGCADGVAFASNKYIAQTLNVSERTVMRLLTELETERYITTQYEYNVGTKEITKRFIHINKLPLLLTAPQNQALYAVIPTHILSLPLLSVQAKLLYAEISAATPSDGFCSKPASYFAEILQTSESSVQRHIRELIEVDALRVEIEYKNNTREVRRRRLYLTEASAVVEKQAVLATEDTKEELFENLPNDDFVPNTPKICRFRGGVIFVTTSTENGKDRLTYKEPQPISSKRRKNTDKLLL